MSTLTPISNNPLANLLATTGGNRDVWRWATVTATDPLRIRLDGDSKPLLTTPDTLTAVTTGDRVRVHVYHHRVTIMGIAGGEGAGLAAYPVGSYYWSSQPTAPDLLFGGVWEPVAGRFIYAADPTHPAGSMGGEEQHVLTTSEMPAHNHRIGAPNSWNWGGVGVYQTNLTSGSSWQGLSGADSSARAILQTEKTGSNAAHNNMPPYVCAYCWHRTG